MVKRRTVRERVEAASEKEHKEQSEVVVPSITKTSHFQRKLAKRLNFHDKLKELQKAAIAKKQTATPVKRRKKGVGKALANFGGLADCLQDIESSSKKVLADPLKLNPKTLKTRARTRLCASEVERTNAVMAHPAFKSNPIAAIMRHLEATVSATEEASKQSKTTRRRRNKNKGSAHGAAKGDSKGDDME
mmetsp:Transcript_14545/g.27942  ORF Transcript_14545/g.27942 Transcript_14545/m.27942 type:complete len:190 (+) Transcript_14545:248-817(+)|eukprot:CAMPEP_0114227136 /NCGR_PEP_ID=MMETSP0058-20121206/1621_1 /TAXON_ID=36894 /ORGANISM="Pyramimonas parkeae, CCMP726" /LENGTH=189 /DNA_ID=CAMNT_0001337941 /DNA_START=135 /DNA_END=704 /DNA_ORIENTATION=+